MKNALLWLLILTMLTSSALVSCSNANESSDTADETSASVSESAGANEGVETETEYDPEVPRVDYEGRTFTILEREPDNTGWWASIDVYSEGLSGEPINDAVFERNLKTEDYFDIVIQPYAVSHVDFKKTLQDSAASGDTLCDLAMLTLSSAISSSQDNLLYDLNEFDCIHLDAPYYTHSVFEDTSILNRNYLAVGDMTLIANEGTWALMFNKEVAEQYHVDDMYELSRNHEWTVDKFYTIMQDIGSDANGDGKVDDGDFYGMITSTATYSALIYALDYKVIDKDENDSLIYRGLTERLTTAAEKIIQIMDTERVAFVYDKFYTIPDSWEPAQHMFENGQSLFYGEVLQCVTRLRNMDVDFGLIPWPMLDESQDTYKTLIHSWASDALTIPTSVADPEMSAYVFEYLSYQSMTYLKPAYFDKTLTYKSMRDEESMEMLEYVLDGRVVDIGYVADIGTVCSGLVNQLNSGKYELSSYFQKKLKAADRQLEKMMDSYNAFD
ncbi:MAG: hypothetical protein ACI4XJ_00590 [Eubacteriales bacterium]